MLDFSAFGNLKRRVSYSLSQNPSLIFLGRNLVCETKTYVEVTSVNVNVNF